MVVLKIVTGLVYIYDYPIVLNNGHWNLKQWALKCNHFLKNGELKCNYKKGLYFNAHCLRYGLGNPYFQVYC
jgi:hypothetical protein